MHVVMAIGRRRTKAIVTDMYLEFEVLVYKRGLSWKIQEEERKRRV